MMSDDEVRDWIEALGTDGTPGGLVFYKVARDLIATRAANVALQAEVAALRAGMPAKGVLLAMADGLESIAPWIADAGSVAAYDAIMWLRKLAGGAK